MSAKAESMHALLDASSEQLIIVDRLSGRFAAGSPDAADAVAGTARPRMSARPAARRLRNLTTDRGYRPVG
jgi:hypothetical protein